MLFLGHDAPHASPKRLSIHLRQQGLVRAEAEDGNNDPFSAAVEANLTVVGRKDAEKEINRAIRIILDPFQLWTWLVILAVFLGTAIVYVLLAIYFARPRTLMNVCRHLLLDFSQSWSTEGERMLNIVSVRTLLFAVAASWVVLILFYESPSQASCF